MPRYKVTIWRTIEQVWEIEAKDEDDAEARFWEGKLLAETSDPDDGRSFDATVEPVTGPAGDPAPRCATEFTGPKCGHSACSQHYIESGDPACIEGQE